MESRDIIKLMAISAASAVAIFIASLFAGCAQVQQWDASHEREYRAEYRDGGGSVSMTVRPYDGKGALR